MGPVSRDNHTCPFQNATKKYDSKKNVWIADPEEGFISGEIKSAKGDMVTVVTTRGDEVRPIYLPCKHKELADFFV